MKRPPPALLQEVIAEGVGYLLPRRYALGVRGLLRTDREPTLISTDHRLL